MAHKPLPAIPRYSNAPQSLTRLTNDAQTHLSSFIRHLLTETDETSFSDGGREAWAQALEFGLTELGDSISRGGWLTGLKRSRKAQKARRDAEREEADKEKARAKKEQEDLGKGKVKRNLKGPQATAQSTDQRTDRYEREGRGFFARTRSPQSRRADTALALDQIRELVSRPSPPTPKPSSKHLLLSVAPLGSRIALPSDDGGFDIVPYNISCVFTTGVFSLPESEADEGGGNLVLYGLDEWYVDAFSNDHDAVRIVGGTFTFKGATTPTQHSILSKVLRMSIFIHLSLILEQHFLANSTVLLQFPTPKPAAIPLPASPPNTPRPGTPTRHAFSPTGIFSYFSKKTGNLLSRTNTIGPILGRSSVDLTPSMSNASSQSQPRPSGDSGFSRLRRFSFVGESRPSLPISREGSSPPFASALNRIEKCKNLLSTSIGVSFAPPPLIVSLAEKEKKDPSRRLKGDETAGLTSILGWEGKDAKGKGMTGVPGFVRQQEFSVLFSQHISAVQTPPLSSSTESGSSETSSSISSLSSTQPVYAPCDRARWLTFRYYSRHRGADKTLGETITELCGSADKPCTTPKCQSKRGQHQLRFIHGGLRITADMDSMEPFKDMNEEGIGVWESCKVCEGTTGRSQMTDGTYLFSFAKFLELLVYSPTICTLTPSICEHTTPPTTPWSMSGSLPLSRINILRHFAYKGWTLSFSLSIIEDVFELRVPRLQILKRDKDLEKEPTDRVESDTSPMVTDADVKKRAEEEKKLLRREIKSWWEGVADHMDQLEDKVTGESLDSLRKSLPRLPCVDDAYGVDDSPTVTPKARVSGLPPQSPSPQKAADPPPHETFYEGQLGLIHASPSESSTSLTPKPPASPSLPVEDPAKLLSSMRHAFQRAEQALYVQLARTPISSLNDVRRSFLSAARGASRRLVAWQGKHLPSAKGALSVENLSLGEPEWWNKSCHAVPGSNVIVRENDWGSIIAFMLSSRDYVSELACMSALRPTSSASSASPQPPAVTSNSTSFFTTASPYKLFTSSMHSQPDPDQEDVIWHEPEAYSAVISRKEHPRDATSLLSFRDVLRQKVPPDGSNGTTGTRFSSLSISATRMVSGAPPSAWAKPAVEVTKQAADGEVGGLPEPGEAAGKILHDIETVSTHSQLSLTAGSDTSSANFESHIHRSKASSIMSSDSDVSDATIGPDSGSVPPSPPMKERREEDNTSLSDSLSARATPSVFANSLTSSLSNAMRYMLNTGELSRPSSPFKNQHGLLSTDSLAIDERPHIKYDWTIGKRLRFSCTAYYAKQFDLLRRRCGVDDVFLKSLGRSANWAAEGGKSKSNFWKTSDDRFIIKTLVNAWNVADLQVLIELAPSYFRYMDATASKPTVLAKLLGFYTVEIKNLDTGNSKAKADLLVMENLFYNQKVAKTFDLKGIQGRKVKAGNSGVTSTKSSKTLFDGEWIEGQQRTLTLVHPHSKIVLRDAIRSDAEFLTKSNIMDYSLLLGVDEERKEIVCGLVDTIGSYTFAKTLEYKAKQGLNSGKDVTVIPPAEYQERFVSALEGYFLACPDKWSRPLDEKRSISDPRFLPSVL